MGQMMTKSEVRQLVLQTLTDPVSAAYGLMGMALPARALWMALALMAVLNSMIYSLSLRGAGAADPDAAALMPIAFQSPILFAGLLFGALAATVFALFWVGQLMGGTARLEDLLVLVAWLQVLRLGLQIVVTVVALAIPGLAAMLVFAGSIWGLYILLGFITAAHDFDSWLRAAGVLIVAMLAMAFGLTLILMMVGVRGMGGV